MQSVLSVSTIFWDESVCQFGRPREGQITWGAHAWSHIHVFVVQIERKCVTMNSAKLHDCILTY